VGKKRSCRFSCNLFSLTFDLFDLLLYLTGSFLKLEKAFVVMICLIFSVFQDFLKYFLACFYFFRVSLGPFHGHKDGEAVIVLLTSTLYMQ